MALYKAVFDIFLFCFVYFILIRVLQTKINKSDEEKVSEVDVWLQEQNLAQYKSLFKESGVVSLFSCAQLIELPGVSSEDKEKLQKASNLLQRQLILKKWLAVNKIEHLYSRLLEVNITSLDEIYYSESLLFGKFSEDESFALNKAGQNLLEAQDDLENLKLSLWNDLLEESQNGNSWASENVVVFSAAVLITFIVGVLSYFVLKAKSSFLQYFTGKYLHLSNCKVFFEWEDPKMVGETLAFTVRFYQRNGRPYPIPIFSNLKYLNVRVSTGNHQVATVCQLCGHDPSHANIARFKFTVRRAGFYRFDVKLYGCHVAGSPFVKHFCSGPPDPSKTQLLKRSSFVVCTAGTMHILNIEPRDEFDNLCQFQSQAAAVKGYGISVHKPNSNESVSCNIFLKYNEMNKRINVALQFSSEGCYHASISFNKVCIRNGDFDIIVLSNADAKLIQKNVDSKGYDLYYEARLLKMQSENLQKPKKVFCYISPRQIVIKEFILKFIPIRLLTFRLCPSTKFFFHLYNNQYDWPTFAIDDGCQGRIELASSDQNIIAATFNYFLLKNIGGSETFKEKQDFFFGEIRKIHQKHHRRTVRITIHRNNLLDSSKEATKNFSASDWCKEFVITFYGEQGIDCGGVRREWFNLVSSSLFDTRNKLFKSFSDSKQALAHPNPRRPSFFNLKDFEFAGKIVGKCLFESALGGKFRQLVQARFTRSFLAQIVGLRIHYKHFEQDDPDLYRNKIKYIIEHDVDEMDLYFVEEEYCGSGQLTRTVELINNGSKIRVSNETKFQYLDCLAQYKLASSVKAEVDHFLKGLNELIPDSLLTIFDENELELLLCGTKEYDIEDFKANHLALGTSAEFRQVLQWFWVAVSNFTAEEMAKLLQFTTGCSQLPVKGFKELDPKFTLVAAPTFGNLPTAHTCFNQLCLPGYDSYEQFEKALLLAIKEGAEGFGFM